MEQGIIPMPGMFITIQEKYARLLGYEHLVGSMAIIHDVMTALCEVSILVGPSEWVGKSTDIHVEDAEIQYDPERSSDSWYLIIDKTEKEAFYSKNRHLASFTHHILMKRRHSVFGVQIPDITSFYSRYMESGDYLVYCLDDPSCERVKAFRDTYEAEKELR